MRQSKCGRLGGAGFLITGEEVSTNKGKVGGCGTGDMKAQGFQLGETEEIKVNK